MKKAVGAACLVALLLVGGAGAADVKDFDANIEAFIKALNKTGDLLATVKDKASADKAKPELKKAAAEMKKLKAESDKLGKPTDEQAAELTKKHKKGVETAAVKLTTELIRLSRAEYAKDVLKEFKQAEGKTEDAKKD